MDYKEILRDLEGFAKDEYSKLTKEFPIINFDNMHLKSSFLEQKLKTVTCKITFNYPKIHIFLWHGEGGSGHALVFDDSTWCYSDEDYVKSVMKSKNSPFRVKNKTVKFS